MYDGTARCGASTSGVRIVVLTVMLAVGLASGLRAEDAMEKAHAEAGQQWYNRYCTPCHGPGGAPGSAVYRDGKNPVDLRLYVQRHGGKFPVSDWIAVVATDNPSLLHTDVWNQIRQSEVGSSAPDVAGRGVVASIANYIRSVQKK